MVTSTPVKLELQKDLARHLRGGHPWVFKKAIERLPQGIAPGTVIDVMERGKFVCRGYADPFAAIAVRVLTRDPAEAIGPLFWRKRIAKAVALRRAFTPFDQADVTDACRLVHGEGDGLPGVVLDLYGKFAVLKLYSAGLLPHRDAILEALRGEVALAGIYGRDDDLTRKRDDDEDDVGDDEDEAPAAKKEKGKVLWGEAPPDPIVITENGAKIAVDVRTGQKTGLFLDQRENRLLLRRFSKGRRAINCFSYTGGFSLNAALGGAREVVSIDRDAGALALAQKSFELNAPRVDPSKHRTVCSDVLEFLGAEKQKGAKWDLIVLDPPAYAKTQKAVPAALDGYASLHRAALQLMPIGGILATASCSARVTAEDFTAAVKEAAGKTGVHLQLLEERRQAPDHPVPLAFPEGKYLKFLVFRRVDE
ncbi:MAG: class I SAM-dependent rRNA methyltransferase [Deltaproteobacteria bacterium]|nr:class I SAM-dependent rRNA methyltransferase [Deltaproteobacteria bacterium]